MHILAQANGSRYFFAESGKIEGEEAHFWHDVFIEDNIKMPTP